MSEEEKIAQIEEAVLPVLRDHGLELVDLEWRAHGPRGIVRVFIDRPGGVGIADCERVSRELGDVLEVADVIPGAYDLQVSSPGLDRTLRKDRELRWAVGKRVRCWLRDAGELTGRLVEVTDDQLGLELEGGERRSVPREGIRRVRLEPVLPWARQSD